MKRIRFSPLLFRRIHKWAGLILGLQFVLWTVSGAVMALLDADKVAAHAEPVTEVAASPWPSDIRLRAPAEPVTRLVLRRVADRPVFEVGSGADTRLIDARSGETVSVDKDLARAIASGSAGPGQAVRDTRFLARPNLEARDHSGPMWRVNFVDPDNSSSYVSARDGRLLVTRNDTYRVWDFVWMLHNMDYVNRASFNHPLIIFVAFGALWLSLTGVYLLFKSFRKRDFRWLLR